MDAHDAATASKIEAIGLGVSQRTVPMFAYQAVALSGSQQYAATTGRGRWMTIWTSTSTVAMAMTFPPITGPDTMAKFLYSAAMSLDGFIAGPGGDMSWMSDFLGPNPIVDDLITRTGAILAGNRTFGGDDPHKGQPGEGEAFGGGWEGPQFVLTHRPPAASNPDVTFVGDIDTAITESRAAAGDKYVNVFGASVAAQCLSAGVLDEVAVTVMPVLLGDGTRLFEHPGGKIVRLEQISVTHTSQLTNVWYRVTA